jgi:hypothetical protein
MTNLKIIAFATDPNEPMLINLINSLEKYGYDYVVIGKDIKWEGFMTKIKGYLNYISKLNPNQLVAIADAYDVMAAGPVDEFISKYKSYGKPIIVGSETFCGPNCIPVDNWWKDKIRPKLQYANSGFCVAPAYYMIKLLNYMLSLNITDDQIAICNYINAYPEEVALDIKAELVSNITQLDFHYLDFQNERIYNKLTDSYPCFVHTPGKSVDFMIRTNYVGTHILGNNYQYTSYSDTFNAFTERAYLRFKGLWIVILIIILIIIIFLAFYSIKLLLVFLAIIILLILFYSRRFKYL